jgi:two-component system, chemotaxis family, protein-glutamate methylesterase/glutaminase
MNKEGFIIVIGASAGGMMAVTELLSQFKEDINAAVLVVLHNNSKLSGESTLERIQQNSNLPCRFPKNEELIKRGYVYVAPPNLHILVDGNKIKLGPGPKENRWRPSIDVLFRSAAVMYNSRVVGVILSGMMNDGTAGMDAIHRCGGTCIVQDPNEAEYPDMVLSALDAVEVNYCLPLEQMGDVIAEIVNSEPVVSEVPEELQKENSIAERIASAIKEVKSVGEKSEYICPDCGGGLWQIVNGNIVRFRCHTGHVFDQNELLIRQSESLENTLWTALRMMEERKLLLERMASQEKSKGWKRTAVDKEDRATDLQEHIERLKQILFSTQAD